MVRIKIKAPKVKVKAKAPKPTVAKKTASSVKDRLTSRKAALDAKKQQIADSKSKLQAQKQQAQAKKDAVSDATSKFTDNKKAQIDKDNQAQQQQISANASANRDKITAATQKTQQQIANGPKRKALSASQRQQAANNVQKPAGDKTAMKEWKKQEKTQFKQQQIAQKNENKLQLAQKKQDLKAQQKVDKIEMKKDYNNRKTQQAYDTKLQAKKELQDGLSLHQKNRLKAKARREQRNEFKRWREAKKYGVDPATGQAIKPNPNLPNGAQGTTVVNNTGSGGGGIGQLLAYGAVSNLLSGGGGQTSAEPEPAPDASESLRPSTQSPSHVTPGGVNINFIGGGDKNIWESRDESTKPSDGSSAPTGGTSAKPNRKPSSDGSSKPTEPWLIGRNSSGILV